MKFSIAHTNINVTDINISIEFYKKALGLHVIKKNTYNDGSFTIAFLADGNGGHLLELTWLRDKEGSYDLGDNESHIAFTVDEYDKAHKLHEEMGCICYENKSMGIYFIEDPDGYWFEIIPER